MKLRTALLALAVTVSGLLVPAVAASPVAHADHCRTVWLTAPSYRDRVDTGTKVCLSSERRTLSSGHTAYALRYSGGSFRDWVFTNGYTAIPPNNGLVQSTADSVRWLANKYDVTVQFAVSDLIGRRGCYGDHPNQISGSYQATWEHPGRGLVRLGTGTTSRCMTYRTSVKNIAKHEIAHALIERLCREVLWGDPRQENITDAYAYRFMGATVRNPGGYGFTLADSRRAAQVYNGNC